MSSAMPVPFLSHGANVKAWCLTGNFVSSTVTQTMFDQTNFVDGFNLRMSLDTQSQTGQVNYTKAIKFSFITPMENDKYKVFISVYGATPRPHLVHVLNSAQYPKTRDYFWVRVAHFPEIASSTTGRKGNQAVNLRLWNGATTRMGVVVI